MQAPDNKGPDMPATLGERALSQLRSNVRTGYDPFYRRNFSYAQPSPGRYRWMWFWDTCCHAIALASLDPDMARRELTQLLATQRRDGFIGHVVYWGKVGALTSAVFGQGKLTECRRRHSAMLQPPMIAQAVETVHQASPDHVFLREALPHVQDYYDWIARERDPDGSGLIWIISPWETGLDNSPAFDEALGLKRPGRWGYLTALRMLDYFNLMCGKQFDFKTLYKRDRFVMVDPLMNAVYADGLRSLVRLWDTVGEARLSEAARQRAIKVESAMNVQCWDADLERWVHLSGRARRPVKTLTAASIMPLIMEATSCERVAAVVKRHLTNPAEFWTPYPVPTVAASELSFDPEGEKLIWRGPVCMNLNWFFVRGLRLHGFSAEADHIAERSRDAVQRSGFREFYSPLTGRGMRGTDFGWAAVAAAM